MPKVIVTAEVEDGAKWEEGFRTHGDHFRSMTVTAPIGIAVNGNEVAPVFRTGERGHVHGQQLIHQRTSRQWPTMG